MEYGYNILFTVKITLENAPDTDFVVSPTQATLQTMRNHGMVFKSRPDSSFVAAPYFINDQQVSSIQRPVIGIQKFTFLIIMKGTRFLENADLQNAGADINRVGRRVYYFSNLNNNNTIDGNIAGDTVALSESAQVSPADIWSVIPASFSFPVDASDYTEVELYHIFPSAPDVKLPSIFKTGMPNARFLLNGYGAGAYQLRWKGTPARTENIYADNDLVRKDFFALAEIYKDDNANNDILNNKATNYTISFKKKA